MTARAPWLRRVSYGAVSATQAADLLQYPPAGYRPFERRRRIGHGDARFEYAWSMALSWGIQSNSGLGLEIAETPRHVTESTYKPVSFDTGGTPIVPATTTPEDETVFGPAGMRFLAPGDTATLILPLGPFRFRAPCRVVYVIDEPKRKGFAYGTLAGHPERGEESFVVEQTDDGSVWLILRSFWGPSTWYFWAGYPVFRFLQALYTRRCFRSLSGPLGP